MRSYIVSLIAVFMALGIGILLGTVIVDNGILADQQNALLKKIGDQMNDLRKENINLKKKVQVSDRFEPEIASFMIRDRLVDKRVAIFCTINIDEPTRKALAQTITDAGGEYILYTINVPELTTADKRTKNRLKELFEVDDLSDAQLEAIVVQNFAEDIAAWKDLSRLVSLAESGWLTINSSFALAPNAVVIIGDDRAEGKKVFSRLFKPIIEVMTTSQIPVVGVETANSKLSLISDFKRAGTNATVDSIDMTSGQIAMVMSISGDYGDFGIKKTAGSLLPELKPLPAATQNAIPASPDASTSKGVNDQT